MSYTNTNKKLGYFSAIFSELSQIAHLQQGQMMEMMMVSLMTLMQDQFQVLVMLHKGLLFVN